MVNIVERILWKRLVFNCQILLNMNKWIYQIIRVLKRLKFNTLAKLFIRCTAISYKQMTIEDAEAYLNQFHNDVRNSCICNNYIEELYDLHIIVPIYNQESFIEECINSILSQKTQYTFFLTLVNDGSTDRTSDILSSYQQHKNIQIITQKNYGASVARNAGLKYIKGKYIMFIDPDDRLHEDAIQKLMSYAEKNDCYIVQGGYETFTNETIIDRIQSDEIRDASILNGYCWGKVIRNRLFANIQFPVGYRHQDSIMSINVLPLCRKLGKRMSIIHDIVVDYRNNPQGVTHMVKGKKRSLDTFYVTRQLYIDQKSLGITPDDITKNFFYTQCRINVLRTITLYDLNIQYAIFLLTCKLKKESFDSSGIFEKNLDLDKAISTGDFKLYLQSCILGDIGRSE